MSAGSGAGGHVGGEDVVGVAVEILATEPDNPVAQDMLVLMIIPTTHLAGPRAHLIHRPGLPIGSAPFQRTKIPEGSLTGRPRVSLGPIQERHERAVFSVRTRVSRRDGGCR
jgi:hypothetical protein